MRVAERIQKVENFNVILHVSIGRWAYIIKKKTNFIMIFRLKL